MAEVGRLWRPAISLPGQIAACEALHATDYYRARWADTCQLRRELAAGLSGLGCEVVPGCVNVVLCHLSETQPAAHILVRRLRDRRLFIADAAGIGGYEGSRRVRIAVMDRDTNLVILEMLREALSSRQSNFSLSSALPHDL
jgi:histidinol-phosphate/aromatic aminotransferase/cobyric acid decarboxylase-like protein